MMAAETYERVDDKGKTFTQRVSTTSVEVDIDTTHGRIHGYMHIANGWRVKDVLNFTSEEFLAITDATIFLADSTQQATPFVAVSRQHIITLVPVGERRPALHGD